MPLVTLSSSAASEVWIGATASGDLKCGQKVFRLVWRFMMGKVKKCSDWSGDLC